MQLLCDKNAFFQQKSGYLSASAEFFTNASYIPSYPPAIPYDVLFREEAEFNYDNYAVYLHNVSHAGQFAG